MVKRVFIVHYWGGNPRSCWYPWLKKELEAKGYKVIVPLMPDTENPKIDRWVAKLKSVVGKLDENTFFIGHSVGCQTILRYLESENKMGKTRNDKKINDAKKIGGILFVAPWLTLSPAVMDSKKESKIAKPWLSKKIDFSKTTSTTKNITAIFSRRDPYVPLENVKLFKELLNAKTLIEKNKGHFDDDSETEKVPVILKYF